MIANRALQDDNKDETQNLLRKGEQKGVKELT